MATTYPTAKDDSTSLTWAAAATDQTIQAEDAVELTEATIALENKVGIGASAPTANTLLRGNGAGSSEWVAEDEIFSNPIDGYGWIVNPVTHKPEWMSLSAGAGENNTLASVGTAGVSIVEPKTGTTLNVDGINSPTGSISVVKNAETKTIDFELSTTNMPTIPVNKGGTGATTAATARENLELNNVTNDPQVILQASTPGTAQTGNSNITGKEKSGSIETGSAKIGSLNGVLKASAGTVAGGATTDDLTEGTGNKYFTDARVRLNRLDQMAAPTANVNINSNKLTNVLDPTSDQDAATKAYVDAQSQGLDLKASVRAASFDNIADLANVSTTFGGVTIVEGDRVLLAGQTTASQNGIYVAGAVAAGFCPLTRSTDANASAKVTSGMYTFVSEGTYASNGYVLTTADPITLDTTELTFTQFSGAGQITAGDGLTKTGNTINAVAGTGITVNANDIAINNAVVATLTDSQTLTNKVIGSGSSYTGTVIGPTYGGTGLTTYAQGDIPYASAANVIAALGIGAAGKVLTSDGTVPLWGDAAKAISDCVVGTGGDYATVAAAYAAGKRVIRLRGAVTETEAVTMTQAVAIMGEGHGKTTWTLAGAADKTLSSTGAYSYFGGFTLVGGSVNLGSDDTGWANFSGTGTVVENIKFEAGNSTTTTTGSMITVNGTNGAYSTVRQCIFKNNNKGRALITIVSPNYPMHICIEDNEFINLHDMRFFYCNRTDYETGQITIRDNRGEATSTVNTAFSGVIEFGAWNQRPTGVFITGNNFRLTSGTGKGIYFNSGNAQSYPRKNANAITDNVLHGYDGGNSTCTILLSGGMEGMSVTGNTCYAITVSSTVTGINIVGNNVSSLELGSCTDSTISSNFVRAYITMTGLTGCVFSGNEFQTGNVDFGSTSRTAITGNAFVYGSGNVTVAGSYNAFTGNRVKGSLTISGSNQIVRGNQIEGTYTNTATLSVTDYYPATVTTAVTHTINAGVNDFYAITAQGGDFTVAAPTGGMNQGQLLTIRWKDDGSQRGIIWNAVFRGIGAALPANTTAGKTSYGTFRYNLTDTKWDLISLVTEA